MNATRPRIVVGIDGSDCSAEALQWALRMAQTTGATVDAVVAWHLPNTYGLAYLPEYSPAGDAWFRVPVVPRQRDLPPFLAIFSKLPL